MAVELAAANRDEDLLALRIDIERVLSELPPELRTLCDRLRIATVREVSRETGVPPSTLYEAIRKLRTFFDRAGVRSYLARADAFPGAPVGKR